MNTDAELLARQMGHAARGHWRAVSRCKYGVPTVIATAPFADGAPFPTLYWLTCPVLVREVGAVESAGGVAAWQRRLAADAVLADRMRAADREYRALRDAEGDGVDMCAGVGVAGQRDVLATKCLHAHVAARLAGLDDPVGEGVLAVIETECDDARCMRDGEDR